MAERKRTDPDWQDVRTFLALARHGSMSAAARALSVNHATVSRRISSLESSIGERVIARRPQGYVLTSAGERILVAAGDMERAAQSISRGGRAGELFGLVRVNAPPALAQAFLTERLVQIPRLHPGLEVDLASDLRSVSLPLYETDIAIRLDRPLDGNVLAKFLVKIGYGYYGTEETRDQLRANGEVAFVDFDEAHSYMPESVWLRRRFPGARIAFRTNNHVAQSIAAKSGAGVALLPHYIGRSEPDLHRCALEPTFPARDLYALIREGDRSNKAAATVIEYLSRAFSHDRELFEP